MKPVVVEGFAVIEGFATARCPASIIAECDVSRVTLLAKSGDRRLGHCVLTPVVLVVSRCGRSGGRIPDVVVDVAVDAGNQAVAGRFPRIDCHIDARGWLWSPDQPDSPGL